MKIDKFWVVTKPGTYGESTYFKGTRPDEEIMSELNDILFEADWARMALQFWGGLKPEEIVAVFDNENEARQLAESLLGGKAKVSSLKLQGIKGSGLKRVAGVIKGDVKTYPHYDEKRDKVFYVSVPGDDEEEYGEETCRSCGGPNTSPHFESEYCLECQQDAADRLYTDFPVPINPKLK